MQLPILLLSAIETAMNAWLRLDKDNMQRFSTMENSVIRLHISGLELNLYFFPSVQSVQVLGHYEGQPDATIHGSPMTLIRLGRSTNAGKTMLETDASIEGNTGLGAKFSKILQEVDIDWEEFLSRAVGDIVAHQMASAGRQSAGWLRDSMHAMRLNMGEYLAEEVRLIAAEAEVEALLQAVDELRMDVDRMEARIKRLQDKAAD